MSISMVIYEFKESVLNEAMDSVEEAKAGLKTSKKALCDIEELLYELYEGRHDDESVEEYDDPKESYEATVEGNDIDINYRRHRNMYDNMRGNMRYGMRKNMRMRKHSYDRYTY